MCGLGSWVAIPLASWLHTSGFCFYVPYRQKPSNMLMPYSKSPKMSLPIRFRKPNNWRPWAVSACRAFEVNKTVMRVGLDISFPRMYFAYFVLNSNENSWFDCTAISLPFHIVSTILRHLSCPWTRFYVGCWQKTMSCVISYCVTQFFAPRHHLQICGRLGFASALVTDQNSWAINSLDIIMINIDPLITKLYPV